jgi:DNA polymerase III subunit epsilon
MGLNLMNLSKRSLFVIDLETSGTSPFIHDVLAVGIAPLNSKVLPQVFYVQVDQEAAAWTPFAATNFRKFEERWRQEAQSPAFVCSEIERYLKEVCVGPATAIGHNVGFDIAFLRKLTFRAGRSDLAGFSHRALDTHTMLYLLHLQGAIPAAALTSDGAFEHFGITVPEHARHTALADALATRDLVTRLLAMFSDEHVTLDA